MANFWTTSDNKVIMPHPKFERQKNRTYSVSIDKNGNKILVPYKRKNASDNFHKTCLTDTNY